MCTTEEEYENIILFVNIKEVEITESAKSLIQAIKDAKVYSCKNLRNALYANGYKQDHDVISVYNIVGLKENILAQIKQSGMEYLFKTDHKVSLGFVEFSGGVNDATTPEKERRDVKKLYSMMIDVMNGYPANVKKQIFFKSTKIENTMFFEELVVHEEVMFRTQHAAIIVPRTIRQLVKFTSEILKLIGWKDAVVANQGYAALGQSTHLKERVHLLQAKFLLRSVYSPDDTLYKFLSYVRPAASRSQWYKLSKTPVWQRYSSSIDDDDDLDPRLFVAVCKEYLDDNLDERRNGHNSVLLFACRPTLGIDPILWLPMSYAERSRSVRWRLGWLPGGEPKPCIFHPTGKFTRSHAIGCLHMHRRLQIPLSEPDTSVFLAEQAPQKTSEASFNTRSIRLHNIFRLNDSVGSHLPYPF
ncbi:hypothetical protein G6F22_008709 [Rhizopus arrhizus]|nr:hypothetical protein G6F22_008709 [Rhizopus arrhizus]KAG1221734.1 hypothetical protein G6F35_005784 [Rhizopus arrhizus]